MVDAAYKMMQTVALVGNAPAFIAEDDCLRDTLVLQTTIVQAVGVMGLPHLAAEESAYPKLLTMGSVGVIVMLTVVSVASAPVETAVESWQMA